MAVGNRKTHVVRATTEPLYQGELDAIEKMKITVAEEKAQRQIADQRAVEAQRAAARADDDQLDALTQAAIDAAVMAESITVSEMPRLFADDATPEALGTLMAEQHGRLAVISAEGGIFDAIAGRYSPIPYLDVYLKGHAGDHLRVDRKGRQPEIIDRPALTICVAFQPGILPQIAGRQGFRARGLLARFLYSVPYSYAGRRHVGAQPLDAEVARRYEDHVKDLVVSLAEWTDPQVLNFGLDADTKLLEYERALEPRLGSDGDLGPIADWASKLAGALVRIAGLLHLATHLTDGYRTPIDGATFDAAACMGDYFLAHAIAAFRVMGADPALADAQALLDWITRTDRTSFSKRDAHYDNRSRFTKAVDVDPPLRLLVDHGYIRPRELVDGPPRGGRPPSPVYDVNPKTAAC